MFYSAYNGILGRAALLMAVTIPGGLLLIYAVILAMRLSEHLCVSWVKPKLCEARDLRGLKDGLVLFVTQWGYDRIYTGSVDTWRGLLGEQPRPRVAQALTQIAKKVLEDGSVSEDPK